MAAAWLDADWPAPPSVRAFTTVRHGAGGSAAPFDRFNMGSHCGDDPATVARNRAELIERAGLPAAPHWLQQVHGTAVWRPGVHPRPGQLLPKTRANPGADARVASAAEGHARDRHPRPRAGDVGDESARVAAPSAACHPAEPEADAAVTSTADTVLAILTADCLPVLFCARDGSEVGAAHAGWRGLAVGVLEATVAAMQTAPAEVLAWLGPAAGPQHYEVGVEVHDAFVARDSAAASAFTSTRPQHWRVDLYALARRRLIAAGVPVQNLHGGGLCTIADPQRFYSHRRDQRTGRMASLIWIAPPR